MPGKARVHELAKEFGVDSKTVLAKLKEQGEFVKSASSTVEAPVARRLRESFVTAGGGNGHVHVLDLTKAGYPDVIYLCEPATGKELGHFETGQSLDHVALSPNGKSLAVTYQTPGKVGAVMLIYGL